MLTFKYAEEKMLYDPIGWVFDEQNRFPKTQPYIHQYNHIYAIGLELNNGIIKQKDQKVNDIYWGFGGRLSISNVMWETFNGSNPDFFCHRQYFNKNHLAYSLYINLGWKFGFTK